MNYYSAPRRIRRGSKVAIVAPASAVETDKLLDGLNVLREVGLVPILGPCSRNLRSDAMHSAPLSERIEELHWAFGNPDISAVLCAKGGMGSAALLPHLDYRLIRNNPKPLLGRSDITALSSGILKHAGLITVNGQTPSITLDKGKAFRSSQEESFAMTLELMMSNQPWLDKPFQKNPHVPQTVTGGLASGPAIGGNSDTFTRLIGTPHMPDLNGVILFLEDVHKSGEFLAREFLHMKLSGILDMVAGVVIGEFQDAKPDEPSVEEVVQEYFSDGPPCVYGFPFSHGAVVSPIPVGAMCHLDADNCEVSFEFCMS